ncbi:hypothetical protein M422DRAFT_51843 [Sphaerobolus stellatus SS14]|uniref:Uncharacterized protein n=1 Tax=Sphaerobolus stellatus (strain SS14) TaxID=990650 RepID=A0A0C9VBB8_SPHS4|nr:hypothetical protein M422DRAFT_51843 [Sphaerobolus stellatus SS14]
MSFELRKLFFADNDASDGYILRNFVYVPDGHRIFFIDWTTNFGQDITIYPIVLVTIDHTLTVEDQRRTLKRVMNMPSQTLNGMPSLGSTAQSLLWDLYGTLNMSIGRDIIHLTYTVFKGGTNLGVPNTQLLASLPSEAPTSYWEIRHALLKKDDSFIRTL